jgi:PKD repeat protein
MAVSKVSSYDAGYVTGDLSVFPEAYDSRYQLYEAKNNAQTTLKNSLTYAGSYVIVENNDLFPSSGILRIGPPAGKSGTAEMVYYETKAEGIFKNIIRGFAGSRQNAWPMGSHVTSAVFAEHHNSVKDAIINIQNNLGVSDLPATATLNGILKSQENRFLAPRAIFRAYPTKGKPGLRVRFQNFSSGPLIRYLWDFGDGTTSVEKSPEHTYLKEGTYTVTLNIISSTGAQGISVKNNYIKINEEEIVPFFYIKPTSGISLETATAMGDPSLATQFNFVDQTDGDITQRYWVFDGKGYNNGSYVDAATISEFNPNVHTTNYIYEKPGNYKPTILIVLASQQLKRAFLSDSITVQ